MASRTSIQCLAVFGGVAALFGAAQASADEAFLCGPSTVVYVKLEDLETKKKTDPCIAAYFGVEVEKVAVSHDHVAEVAKEKAGKAAVAELKRLEGPERSEPLRGGPERSAALMPPEASEGTDFRNVRIINASTEGERWFRHDK